MGRILSEYTSALLIAAFAVLLGLDIFLWTAHPTAILAGGALGYFADPLILLLGLLMGASLGTNWKAVLASAVAAIALEVFMMNSDIRNSLGVEGFLGWSAASRFIALLMLVTVVGLLRRAISRRQQRQQGQ